MSVVEEIVVIDAATTRDETGHGGRQGNDAKVPGVVVVFAAGRPTDRPLRLDRGPIELGRGRMDGVIALDDERASRRHVRIALAGKFVRITDLGSRNGTFVDGQRIDDVTLPEMPHVLRVGQTLLAFTNDIRGFVAGGIQVTPFGVIGPTLRAAHAKVVLAATGGEALLIHGPSGAGKELAARRFHEASGRKGPLIAVNCATIPSGLAERLLFGARRGTYSGASSDSEGHVQAAHGGTLFLDEVAELDIAVQPKLLRVLEEHEVLPLGALQPKKVEFRICAATARDMREEVRAGRFREDLYFRIGRPEVWLPPLVERLEEIPFLIECEAKKVDASLAPGASLIETCMLRAWPGNVRELIVEVRHAARTALAAGRSIVEPADLSPKAGHWIKDDARKSALAAMTRKNVEAALREEHGNVSSAARALGVHRTQLRRFIERHGIDVKVFGGQIDETAENSIDAVDLE